MLRASKRCWKARLNIQGQDLAALPVVRSSGFEVLRIASGVRRRFFRV
jgi:hypothetical protein